MVINQDHYGIIAQTNTDAIAHVWTVEQMLSSSSPCEYVTKMEHTIFFYS
jgi:hypothetical protein